jgi:hypothetical protein
VPQVEQGIESTFCRWFECHSDLSSGSVPVRHLMSMLGVLFDVRFGSGL